jgi:hypothetical protein
MPGYIGSYAMDGLAMALHCVYTTETFKQALVKVRRDWGGGVFLEVLLIRS